jgi:aerobic carbon-monoxide dehydrogenase medium subunit
VKAAAFDYVAASSVPEAAAVLGEQPGEARILAGGQSLVPMLAMRMVQPAVVVDINGVGGLDAISVRDGALCIGALARYSAIERSPLVTRHAPLLADALRHVADRLVRNRGTLAGSLAQADPSGEGPLASLAIEAVVVAQSTAGRREIPVGDLLLGPYETSLQPDEVIVEVRVPIVPARRHVFLELARRHGDYAVVSVAALGVPAQDPGTWRSVRVVLGAAGPLPFVAEHAGALLAGGPLTDAAIEEAAQSALGAAEPASDARASARYREHLVPVYVRRALGLLRDRWGG